MSSRVPPLNAQSFWGLGFGVLVGIGLLPVWALGQVSDAGKVTDLSFEELGEITVSTVSRRDEKLFSVPAAISVLTRDVVQQLGALSVPEALRTVPGLNVAQINTDTWAVGARGFQWQFANKLLVMIDGRSVYSPTAGGVRWEDNPVYLEDLEQIEVIRGPGSSIWGANAVNGVINIVSRSAFETLGSHAFTGFGSELEGLAGARLGLRLSEKAAMRIYGQFEQQKANVLPGGASAEDGYWRGFGGWRLDWTPNPDDTLTLIAGFHERRTDYVRTLGSLDLAPSYALTSTFPVIGRNRHLSGKWHHLLANGSSFTLQAYWDRSTQERPQNNDTVTTWDVDAFFSNLTKANHRLSAGVGLRLVDSHLGNGFFRYEPTRQRPLLFSGFIQDEITLRADRLKLSLGTKVEHHTTTGWNIQPSARLSWTPGDRLTLWGSLGKAVRIPTLSEQTAAFDARVYLPGVFDPVLPAALRVYGNPDLKPETLIACETGLRWRSPAGWTVDLSAFAYDYRDYILVTGDRSFVQSQPPGLVLGQKYANGIEGESYGGELALSWNPRPWWHLNAHVSFLRIQLHTNLSDPFSYELDENTTPRTTASFSSNWNLGRHWQLNGTARFVDPVAYYRIPSYLELDARLSWVLNDHVTVSLLGRNLLDSRHPEYDSALNRRLTELQRSVSLICQWRY